MSCAFSPHPPPAGVQQPVRALALYFFGRRSSPDPSDSESDDELSLSESLSLSLSEPLSESLPLELELSLELELESEEDEEDEDEDEDADPRLCRLAGFSSRSATPALGWACARWVCTVREARARVRRAAARRAAQSRAHALLFCNVFLALAGGRDVAQGRLESRVGDLGGS